MPSRPGPRRGVPTEGAPEAAHGWPRTLIVGCCIVLFGVSGASCLERKNPSEPKTTAPVPREVPPALLQPEEPRTALEEAMEAPTIEDAVEVVKPLMTDTFDETSPGASLFAAWATSRMRWEHVQNRNETSFALVQKDSEEARGRRMCIAGMIVEIAVKRRVEAKTAEGLLWRRGNIVRFIAIGSTGNLVQRQSARFCGVVIGKHDYSNSGGGVGHAVEMVGMFEIPQNKVRPTKSEYDDAFPGDH